MRTLDCSSITTARTTVAEIIGMTETNLRQRLREINVPEFEEPVEYIVRELLAVDVDDLPRPDGVHWFHASRVIDPERFTREGILPKAAVQPRLRKLLEELAHGLVAEGESPTRYSTFVKSRIDDEGPFAFLIRTAALHVPGDHFTKAPESVVDISGEMLGQNAAQLIERFQGRSAPCIVTFRGPGEPRHVARAIQYLKLVEQGHPEIRAASAANTCYIGAGRAVLPSEIVSVDRLSLSPD